MKLLLVFATILAVSQTASYSERLRQEWNTFKVQHSKKYSNLREEQLRMKIFAETKERIAKHNEAFARGEVTYKMGLNKFADLTEEEFVSMMTGFKSNEMRKLGGQNYTRLNVALPSSVDWRKEGAVTAVKNQGQCGSCWAFSATGALEGQYFRKTGRLVSLSEQNLMDCSSDYGNGGCSGGLMDAAFHYIIDNGGIDTEASYPYEEEVSYCRFSVKNIGAHASSYVDIPSGDQQALKEAVANKGPVAVAMNAGLSSFHNYESGIYYDSNCGNGRLDLNHGVLAVGYGNEDGTDYWIVKNSWDSDWGESGFFRISFNNNNCGIATMASYPVV